MRQEKKIITAFVLLLLVAMPVFFALEFMLKEKLLKEGAGAKLESVSLQTIRISTNALCWVKKGKEVIIDGKMFDVKTYKITNDIVTLTGYFDTEETKLKDEFTKFIEHGKTDTPLHDVTLKFLFFPVYDNQGEIINECHWQYISSHYFSYDELIPIPPSLLLSRPPRLRA